jgi:hypothetical protein
MTSTANKLFLVDMFTLNTYCFYTASTAFVVKGKPKLKLQSGLQLQQL